MIAWGMFKDMRVVELANVLAGPSVGMFFAEQGAEVIKIENLRGGGDVTRTWKLPSEAAGEDVSAYFSCVNWGKGSLALDLGDPKGLEVLHRLVRDAEVVIASYKPGDASKLGVDYDSLRQIRPDLIYGEITGYGPDDPRVAYDAVLQAETGFTYLNGEPDGGPVKMPVALIDVLAGHHLKEGLLMALLRKARTGEGARVSVSLFDTGVVSLVNQATNWLVGGVNPGRKGSSHPNIVPYGTVFHAQGGQKIVLAVGSDKQFRALCEVLGHADRADDPRFRTNPLRVKHRQACEALVAKAIEGRDREELLEKLQEARVPAGAVRSMKDLFSGPLAQNVELSGSYPDGKEIRGVKNSAFLLNGWGGEPLSPPPRFNGQGREILAAAGYSPDEIQALINAKITGS